MYLETRMFEYSYFAYIASNVHIEKEKEIKKALIIEKIRQVIELMKDELGGNLMTELLRPKICNYLTLSSPKGL